MARKPSAPETGLGETASDGNHRQNTASPQKGYSRAWLEARSLIWKHRRSVGIGLVLMVFSSISGFVLPLSSKYLIDEVLTAGRHDILVPLAALCAFATFVQAATAFSLSQVVSVAAQKAIADLRAEIQNHLIRLPVSYFDSTKSGVLISRVMNDPEGVRNLVGTGLIQLTGGLLTATFAVGVLLWINWQMTLGTILMLGLFAIGMSFAFKKLRPIFRERGAITADVSGRLAETIGGIRLIKVYTAEDKEAEVFNKGVMRLFENISRSITGTSATAAMSILIVGATSVIVMIAGGKSVISGSMTLGDLFMYVIFIGLVAAPLIQIANIGTQLTEAFAGLDRIRELRDMAREDDPSTRINSMPPLEGKVEFKDVWYEYEAEVPVLKGVSFLAEPGTTTALVGSSGSGKSTLISLIMAFAKTRSGQILVDGTDISTVNLQEYRSQIGVVLQDNFLFDGTVRDNIAFTRPSATNEEIRSVAATANADEFITHFPDGYDTVIGERGVKLSGGQRQRIAIARAILADPKILILDEATSSLDSESEHLIQAGLKRLRKGRTTFVIAHRLSTITSSDQILVLENGEIVERGSHDYLLSLNGRYRTLYDRQYRFENDRYVNPGEDPVVTGTREQ